MKLVKNVSVILSGIVGTIFLLNPTFGMLELIPDVTPVIGNLDEAAATALVINAILYFRRSRKAVTNIEPEQKQDQGS